MVRILVVFALFILGLNSEHSNFEKVIDEISSKMYRYGDPQHLFSENDSNMKAEYEGYLKTLEAIEKETKEYVGTNKGLEFKLSELGFNNLLQSVKLGIEKSGSDLFKKYSSVANKRVDEASKVRFSLVTALHEASKKDTKTTIPILICYLKKYSEKMVAVYKDIEELKGFVEKATDYYVGSLAHLMEKERGPAADHCDLPEASSNPTHWKSVSFPLIEAIKNLENKK